MANLSKRKSAGANGKSFMRNARRAFTLVELLTVIAITAVLLTIIVLPVVQTFNLTRSAQAFQEAQDRARIVTERISREMSNSAGVRDNSGVGGQINAFVPAGPGSADAIVAVPLANAKIDLFPPAQEGQTDPGGGFIDPNTGRVDPTLKSPKGQVVLSAATGLTLVRYFIARRNPLQEYNNPYQVWSNDATDGAVLKSRNGGRDNLYVLYRAEIVPYISVLDNRPGAAAGSRRLVVNPAYFDVDPATVAPGDPDPRAGVPLYDDPNFIEPNRPAGVINTVDAKAIRIGNWLDKATVVTELSRYDMIQPFFDKSSRKVVFDQVTDAGGTEFAPRLLSLVSFKPTRVSEGAAEGKLAVRPGEESDNAATIAPDVFTTSGIGWVNAKVTMFPVFTDPSRTSPLWNQNGAPGDPFSVGRKLYQGQVNPGPGISIYGCPPGSYPEDQNTIETELFDVTGYENAVAAPTLSRYPFTYGVSQANARSGWLGSIALKNEYLPVFAPYMPDGSLGRILASFGIDQVGNDASGTPPPPNVPNLPLSAQGPEVTPSNDVPANPPQDPVTSATLAAINTGTFSDIGFNSINRKFNKIWFDYAGQDANHPNMHGNIQRFIDLRVTPQMDGSASPLDPTNGFPRARIVPGSEEVIGPDQRPGPNEGFPIRYTRTTSTIVGPNQYRINYVNQVEPDYTNPGLGLPPTTGFIQGQYDSTNFISAVIQPRFKAGYIQLNSDPNAALPAFLSGTNTPSAPISVYYKFQFTQAVPRPGQPSGVGVSDTFSVEYDSRQLMSVQVTIRNYPQTTLPNVQTVTLKAEAPIRNYLR
jgi:prepilin-type N-terminal cleavage/methylation domain-containing protein